MLKYLLICPLLLLIISRSAGQNTLNDYLNTASKNSPLVHDNQNLSKISELEAERLHAFYKKAQVNLTGNFLFAPIVSTDNNQTRFEPNPTSANNYYGFDLATSNGGLYQGLINFNQPLFNGGKAFVEQAELLAETNQNTAKLSIHDLEKLVTDQYILCLQDQNQLVFADSMISLLREQVLLVGKMVEGGLLKQSDLALVKIELQNYNGLHATYKGTYQRDLMDLNVLSGIGDTSVVMIEDPGLKLKRKEIDANFLQKYSLDSLNVLATQKVFNAKYKPQLNLIANIGLNAVYAPAIPNRFGFSAGLNFTWNIFDGHQRDITRKKTEIQLETVSFYKENFLAQNLVRKARVLSELKSYEERLAIMEDQLKEYQNVMRSFSREILQGQLSIVSYITTLKNRNMVQRDYLTLQTNRLLLINMDNYWNW